MENDPVQFGWIPKVDAEGVGQASFQKVEIAGFYGRFNSSDYGI
jgi:hypothetical protein